MSAKQLVDKMNSYSRLKKSSQNTVLSRDGNNSSHMNLDLQDVGMQGQFLRDKEYSSKLLSYNDKLNSASDLKMAEKPQQLNREGSVTVRNQNRKDES